MEVAALEGSVLLDTHSLIWAVTNHSLLSRRAAHAIDNAQKVYVSAVTAWEIATKVRLGKLPEAAQLERNFLDETRRLGFSVLVIEATVALEAGRFSTAHKDPFDRMLAAQALALDMSIISIDPELDAFGVRRIW